MHYVQRHTTKKALKDNKFLELNNEEQLLGKFNYGKETKWKAFGNNLTDFVMITNLRIVTVHLIKAGFPGIKEEEYVVHEIPLRNVIGISLTESHNGKQKVKFDYFEQDNTDTKTADLPIYDDAMTFISLYKSTKAELT